MLESEFRCLVSGDVKESEGFGEDGLERILIICAGEVEITVNLDRILLVAPWSFRRCLSMTVWRENSPSKDIALTPTTHDMNCDMYIGSLCQLVIDAMPKVFCVENFHDGYDGWYMEAPLRDFVAARLAQYVIPTNPPPLTPPNADEPRDRLPTTLCAMIRSFLGSEDQRTLRRAMLHLMTGDANDLSVCVYASPTVVWHTSAEVVTIFFDRRALLFPGQFRGITSLDTRWTQGGVFTEGDVVNISEFSPDLEEHLDHCCRAFEQTFPTNELADRDRNPLTPSASDEVIDRILLDLRFGAVSPTEIELPDNSPVAKALREFMPFVEAAARIERRRQLGQEEEKTDPDEYPFTEISRFWSDTTVSPKYPPQPVLKFLLHTRV